MASSLIRERARDRRMVGFVGRERELRMLHDVVAGQSTFVVHVHGVAGIGKSSLLGRFADEARTRGATVIEVDGRHLEPTDRGIYEALADALGVAGSNGRSTGDAVVERLGAAGDRVVIVVDHYEVLRLVDTWLRQELVPGFAR